MSQVSLEKKLKSIKRAGLQSQRIAPLKRDDVFRTLSLLLEEYCEKVLHANQKDLQALPKTTTPAFRDRLTLSRDGIQSIKKSLEAVALLPSPFENVVEARTLQNGLKTRRVRAPLGVIFMIFESRPNVAIEAFSLAFKAGNALILRGGSEAQHTTRVFYNLIQKALTGCGFPAELMWGIANPDRRIPQQLLKQRGFIDVVVPRGGDRLIDYVVKNSLVPIIKNDRGLCHVYVDEDADLEMALKIIINAKTSRPGVCNSIETILVHSSCAKALLTSLYPELQRTRVMLFCDKKSIQILHKKENVKRATDRSWSTEYLDLMMNCRVVKSMDEALRHIARYGSGHSEAICTRSSQKAKVFQESVDAAAVYWNASTRFTDGFELGLGGELGISTQKIHVRGPVGLNELTCLRWLIDGTGQVR